jgi:uncharacterized membrane protein
MTVTTAATTPAGSYSVTISGTGGGISHTTTVTLIVSAPGDFSLTASPSTQTVTQGAGTSYSVTIARTGGFSGSVAFSVSGLPAGASGTFNPSSTSGNSSTLTVTTGASTPAGTYQLTVRGTSGALSHTTQVTLVVNAASGGDFSLSASPTSRTILQGDTTTYTVTVNRSGGFAGGVTLSAGGLPSGATAAFSPNPTTGTSSNLTVSTSGNTPVGTYSIVITGGSGSLTRTATVSLTVDFGDN